MVQTSRANAIVGLATAWAIGLFCMGSAMHGKWLLFPLSKLLRGTEYSLGPFTPGAIHFVPWSFGCVAAGLMFVGLLAYSFRQWTILSLIGALLLWLAFFGAFKAVLVDARLLQTLGIEQTQQQSAFLFTQQALPTNYGSEPSVWTQLDLSSVEARLIAGWYFIHFGWWATLVGSLLAIGYGVAGVRSAWPSWLAGVGTVGLFLACALGPALSERTLMRARALEAQGDFNGAIRAYRQAMAQDRWQALGINNYASIGGLDSARDQRDTSEYHVYHAQLPSTQADLPATLDELRAARPFADPVLARLMRKRESELSTLYARAMHALGAFGAAASASEYALQCDPDSVLPGYYLARDAYLVGRYSQAISLSNRLLLRLDDPTVRSNLFSNVGDALTQLGDYPAAKVAYRGSYEFDYVLNLRALSALNGPGRDLQ